ncbi:MAG TPA: long-chain fatty acid--CoA ligase [Gammaproteobacteria bacterium]|nr:long-chain fatty acid--CoA ligase [Gammaproteobacteria bacterium]
MTEWQEDLITAEAAGTLDGLLFERVHRSPDAVAYRDHDKASGQWLDIRWREVAAQVSRWRAALAGEGFEPGDRAALSLRNCADWVYFDQAALGEGLVSVPLYTDDRPDNVAYILHDAAVSVLLLQNLRQWKALVPALGDNTTLQRVLILEPADVDEKSAATEADPRLRFVEDWLPATAPDAPRRDGDPHALASIVYTSGTTGRPKGVMLSHYNMLSVAHAAVAAVDCYQQDLFLSFLPLSHTLERTAGYYLPVMAGATVAHARSVLQLAEDLVTVKPTVMIAVPRIFERVHGRIMAQLEKKSPLARSLFQAAVRIGWQHFQWRQGRAAWSPELLLNPLLRKLVGDKVTAKLGGRMRFAISGGAALPLPVARVFIGLGLPILQGYGLTETSPVISVTRDGNNDPASVGEPLRGIEVRIGDKDELLVKSPGIMLGYWNNHAATAEMIDPDGWLHTGDQARIENGCIYITGRIKDILVLSNGEKIPPGDMESAICLDPLFEQALVVGEGRPCLAALVVLSSDLWFGFAKEQGLDPFARESLEDSRLQKKVLVRIQQQLHDFPGYARIRRVSLMLDPWTVENGLLTPTLKVKRAKVMDAYREQIEALYAQ